VKSWKASLKLIAYYPGWYAASAGVWALAFFVPIGTGLAMRGLLDRLAAGPATLANAWSWIALILAIRLGRSVLDFPAAWVFAHHLGRVRTLLRANLLRGYLRRLGTQEVAVDGVGDALNRLRDDVEPLAHLAADDGVDALGRAVRLVVMLGILLAVNPTVTLAVVPPLVGCALLAQVLSARLVRYREASRRATGEMASYLNEMLGGVQALKLAGAEAAAAGQFEVRCEARRRAGLRDTLASETAERGLDGLTQLAGGLVLLVAAPALTAGTFSAGDLALFISCAGQVTDVVSFFTHMLVVYRQADVSAARLAALVPEGESGTIVERGPIYMDGRLPEILRPERTPDDRLQRLEVRGLTCRHAGNGHGIEDVSFSLEAGTLTVITGPVGSGKSTLLRALLGLLPLDGGEARWNGQVVEDLGGFLRPPRAAYVPQTPVLFSDTLKENVLLGLEVSDEELEQALHVAVLGPDVEVLSEGLETVIGPRGVKLSGGQQQRAAAARALVREPELLVLDDLSSALDVETERLLWERILGRGRTVLAVSHRPEVLRRADEVIVLREGRVEAVHSGGMREPWGKGGRG
jgi:ATP-binding cassette subfamily B protein